MNEVICSRCCGLDEGLETMNLDINDLNETPPVYIVGYAEEGAYYCGDCGDELFPTESYIHHKTEEEEIIRIVSEKIGDLLSEKFNYCSHCPSGQEIEALRYVAEKEEIDSLISDAGEDLYDFLSENGVPESYRDSVLKNIVCPNCNHGVGCNYSDPDNGYFELQDKVYTNEEIDSFWGFDEQAFIEIAKKYNIDIDPSKLSGFSDYLFERPLLAYKHPIGKELYKTLEKIYSQKDYFKLEIDVKLFRGRNRGKDKKQYTSDVMWNPPKGETSHGRYNPVGISVLYCTDDIKGIPYEIEPKKNEVTDVATFTNRKVLNLLDIDEIFSGFEGFLSSENQESTNVRKGYLITNFIAICCIEIGFDGVKYNGANGLGYYNYAFFTPNSETFNVSPILKETNFTPRYDFS
ncbi:hypothetical protein AMR94_07635 [Bacillus sp. G3(2015)]|uniref:RES domain-containing protein n=1 Tax=Bacillus sp. G3(2015) TaxID=1706731 RepID=UPI00073875EC|nr:RES domain-containing protein [Bacillus sp. G3(2015)]KUF32694.1 hypothetical protein AMR94_07635 [Bacillus sp. G3(2015)]